MTTLIRCKFQSQQEKYQTHKYVNQIVDEGNTFEHLFLNRLKIKFTNKGITHNFCLLL